MKVLIASDIHCYSKNNQIFVDNKVSKVIERYANAFGKVCLCIRIGHGDPTASMQDITGFVANTLTFDTFSELYSISFTRKAEREVNNCDLVIGRFESFSACRAFDIAKKIGKPFFSEVMSDPWDGLWNHGFAGKMVAPWAFLKTRQALNQSDYALYVTSNYLQKRYPCKCKSVGVSNVFISEPSSDVLERRIQKIRSKNNNCVTLMTTAATYVKYKGQAYVIKAIPKLNKIGIQVRYLVVGEGDQKHLRSVASSCKVADQVEFLGRLPLSQVLDLLTSVDIYIQPSLQEGLPRAVIEAMSRACPAIGARTAGIPELIQEECIFKRKSSNDIVRAILGILTQKKQEELARDNFERAKNYSDEKLAQKRNEYYEYVKCTLSKQITGENPRVINQ